MRDHGSDYAHYFGPGDGPIDVGVIAFGSTEGVIREAMASPSLAGYRVALLHLRLLSPLPVEQINQFAARCKSILVPELNYSGQLAALIRSQTRVDLHPYHKDEGIPFVAGAGVFADQ